MSLSDEGTGSRARRPLIRAIKRAINVAGCETSNFGCHFLTVKSFGKMIRFGHRTISRLATNLLACKSLKLLFW
jgi:hypothetical protein